MLTTPAPAILARVSYQILNVDGHVLNMRTRMPFRFGITTMTFTPHLFLRVELAIDGQRVSGIAADHLPPKWFTKNPATSVREDVTEMIGVIEHAIEAARSIAPAASPFALWRVLYARQASWAEGRGV